MDPATIVSDLPSFALANDNRHDLSQLPNTREAAVYMLPLPQFNLAGLVYTWVSWKGEAAVSVCLFGEGVGEKLEERSEMVNVPPEMDFYDWRVGGLTMKIVKPFESATIDYQGERIQLSFTFDAMHPVYPFSAHKNGCPQYYALDRTEQHGRARGHLTIDGRVYALDTPCQRDRAWGPRVWGLNQHYKWFHATTDTVAVHFFEMQSFGRVHQQGFVFRDNHISQITRVEHEYVFDEDLHHTQIQVVAFDEAGRRTELLCKTFAKFEFNADPMIRLKESPITVETGGETGAGWCEFCWNKEYFDFAKQYVQFAN